MNKRVIETNIEKSSFPWDKYLGLGLQCNVFKCILYINSMFSSVF